MKYEVKILNWPSNRVLTAKNLICAYVFSDLKLASDFLMGQSIFKTNSREKVESIKEIVGSHNVWVEINNKDDEEFGSPESKVLKQAEEWYESLKDEQKAFVDILGRNKYWPLFPASCCP